MLPWPLHFILRTTHHGIEPFILLDHPIAPVLFWRRTPRTVGASTRISSDFHHFIIFESTMQSDGGTMCVGRATSRMFIWRYGHSPRTFPSVLQLVYQKQYNEVSVTIYTPSSLPTFYLTRPF
jgi:hypothetical protein